MEVVGLGTLGPRASVAQGWHMKRCHIVYGLPSVDFRNTLGMSHLSFCFQFLELSFQWG